jgi:hypothetical protein
MPRVRTISIESSVDNLLSQRPELQPHLDAVISAWLKSGNNPTNILDFRIYQRHKISLKFDLWKDRPTPEHIVDVKQFVAFGLAFDLSGSSRDSQSLAPRETSGGLGPSAS